MVTLIALLFIFFGIWTVISPKSAFNFKARIVKSWGVTMTASSRSFKVMRYIGVIAVVVGFLLYTS